MTRHRSPQPRAVLKRKTHRLVVQDEVLRTIRELFLRTAQTNHTFINYRSGLTDIFLYQYVLHKLLQDKANLVLLPFSRPVRRDIAWLSPQIVNQKVIDQHLKSVEPLPISSKLVLCQSEFKSSCNFALKLADDAIDTKKRIIMLVDPQQPEVSDLESHLWQLLRDSPYLNLTVWLHASPAYMPISTLDQFDTAFVFNPSYYELGKLSKVWRGASVNNIHREEIRTLSDITLWMYGAAAGGNFWTNHHYKRSLQGEYTVLIDHQAIKEKQGIEKAIEDAGAIIDDYRRKYVFSNSVEENLSIDYKIERQIEKITKLKDDYQKICAKIEAVSTHGNNDIEPISKLKAQTILQAVDRQGIIVLEQVRETKDEMIAGINNMGLGLVALTSLIESADGRIIALLHNVDIAIEDDRFSEKEQQELLVEMQKVIDRLVARENELPTHTAALLLAIREQQQVTRTKPDTKVTLKLTLPIIPLILSLVLEPEFDLSLSRLKQLWDRFTMRSEIIMLNLQGSSHLT